MRILDVFYWVLAEPYLIGGAWCPMTLRGVPYPARFPARLPRSAKPSKPSLGFPTARRGPPYASHLSPDRAASLTVTSP